MTLGCDLELELPFLELYSPWPLGCHTMFPQPVHEIIWFLYPANSLLQAGQVPCTII